MKKSHHIKLLVSASFMFSFGAWAGGCIDADLETAVELVEGAVARANGGTGSSEDQTLAELDLLTVKLCPAQPQDMVSVLAEYRAAASEGA